MEFFKDRLKKLRENKNLTQSELANELNHFIVDGITNKKTKISTQTISYWENGREPSYDMLIKIASFFETSIDYLIGKTDIVDPNELLQRDLFKNDFDINSLDTRVMKYINDIKTILKNTNPGVNFNNTLIIQNTFIKIMAKQQAKIDSGMHTNELLPEFSTHGNSFITGKKLYDMLYDYYLQQYKRKRMHYLGPRINMLLQFSEDHEFDEKEISEIKEYYKDFPKDKIPKKFVVFCESNK